MLSEDSVIYFCCLSKADSFSSSTNEKLDRSNFIEGTKLLGTYLYEVAAITSKGS